jgi:hypothetical protein
MVSFTLWPLHPMERDTGTHWIKGWVSPRGLLDDIEK